MNSYPSHLCQEGWQGVFSSHAVEDSHQDGDFLSSFRPGEGG